MKFGRRFHDVKIRNGIDTQLPMLQECSYIEYVQVAKFTTNFHQVCKSNTLL